MLRSILLLFSSSFIGRLFGLLRFQGLLYVFGQSSFSDTIIYFTTFVWLVNNFFITPIVNRSLIADLGRVDEIEYFYVINALIKKVLKAAFISGLSMLFFLEAYNFFYESLELDIYSKFLIILIFPILGLNEIFSLFNQFKGKYFLYSLNTAIWNVFLLFSLMLYYFLNIKDSFVLYFFFLFLGKVSSLILQFKNTHINLNVFNFLLEKKVVESTKKEHKQYFYNLSIIIFSSITFFDLNLLSTNGLVGVITVYSIILKLPSLLQSLLTSALIPVFFNKLVLEKGKFFKTIFQFSLLCFLCFLTLGLLYVFFGDLIYELLFNYKLLASDNENLILGLLYMFLSLISFFLIRLSVEFKFQKVIFITLLFGLFFKLIYTQIVSVTVYSLLTSNLIIFLIFVCFGIIFLKYKSKTYEHITT